MSTLQTLWQDQKAIIIAAIVALLAAASLVACSRPAPPSISGVRVGQALAETVDEVGLEPGAVEALI
ncbi:MAG: hypothetical protein B7Y31_14570, partial [Novosphingobium sp. 16-62-11]